MIPLALTAAITDSNPAVAERALDPLMRMKTLDIVAVEVARRG
jgi:hypothetical protein